MSYNPLRGEPAEEETQVWIAYDAEAIYFAFRCLDSQPGRIRTTISRRDNAFSDDWVGFSLDSSRAGQLAYHLFVNPSGIQMDALQSGSSGEDFAPDWVWESAARIGSDGWSAEIRVPLENIRFRSGANVRMGVLFWRRLSRTGVSSSWPEISPAKWVFDSHAAVAFDTLQSRRLLEFIPSATFSSNQARRDRSAWDGTRARGDVGVSVKYGITSAITLDATVNPDFSQVESDAFEVEVNQRFPVFFSEKRPFFMEGMGLFNIAGTGGDSTMRTAVHTRTIIDPSAGLKLTGAAGRHTFGMLSSADAAPPGSNQRIFTIGREVMNFGRGQYVGVLLTDTEFGNDYNRVAGGDVAFKRGEHFQANASFLASYSRSLTGETSRGNGAQGSYDYSTRRFTVAGQLEHYDPGFRMDTAFINRVGVTRGWQYQALNFYPSHPAYLWIKQINPFFWMVAAEDEMQGGSEAFYLPAVRFNFTRSGFLRVDYGTGHETYAGRRFEIGRMMVDGNVQLTRWLNIGGSVQQGPAIFYDPEDALSGGSSKRERAHRPAAQRAHLQQHVVQLRHVRQSPHRRERVSRAHRQHAQHVSVHAAVLRARGRAVRFVARTRARPIFWRRTSCRRALSCTRGTGRCSERVLDDAGVRSLHGDGARVLLQSVLSRALLIAATSRPALRPSRL